MGSLTDTNIKPRAPLWLALLGLLVAACDGSGGRATIIDRIYDSRSNSSSQSGGHEIKRGETVYGIAQRYGVSTRALIDWNSLGPPYTLVPGERIRLPQSQGYVVQRGDSVYAISRRFGVDMATLVRANNMRSPYTIQVGQRLKLPSNAAPVPATANSSMQTASLPPMTTGSAAPSASPSSVRSAPKPAPPRPVMRVAKPPPRAATGFIWPVEGRVLSSFGAKKTGLHNDGVNIAAPRGAPVRAADNGIVAYSGKEIRGFGNLLLIKHDGGLITAYAHTDTLLVSRGDTVTRGQVIGKVGTTGGVDTPQLHFEVRQGTRAVNPSKYLPG
ncbi:MAG: LysM peptidoglycan-binding domain-containing M23 family metallopeptidase [Alphaproteobacteria bacterium]|nr:LysM peptidoglycan-binding domain-containing M23 family metallopeptidase [Alphaproteobacteria bacterium]